MLEQVPEYGRMRMRTFEQARFEAEACPEPQRPARALQPPIRRSNNDPSKWSKKRKTCAAHE